MRRLVLVLIVTAVVCVLAAANFLRETTTRTVDWQLVQAPPREVLTEPPQTGLIVQTISAPGTVEAVDEVQVASQVVGRVREVLVEDGAEVREGQLLVQLDDDEAKARLLSVEAHVARLMEATKTAQAELEKARRDADRSDRLSQRNAATSTELADARTALVKAQKAQSMSEKDLEESRRMVDTNRKTLTYTEIRAPIGGRVSGLKVEKGEVVIAGTTNLPGSVLMTITSLEKMRVRAEVDETDVRKVRDAQPAHVYLQSDLTRSIPGQVGPIAPKGKKTGEVVSFETLIVELGLDDALKPGMSATVEIEVDRVSQALSVPVQAVVYRRRKDLPDTPAIRAWSERSPRVPGEKGVDPEARYLPLVFIDDHGIARARPVEIGLSDEKRVEIRSGVEAEDRVVIGPFRTLDALRDGDHVGPAKTPNPAKPEPGPR
jgi:HlyD family secretion protein